MLHIATLPNCPQRNFLAYAFPHSIPIYNCQDSKLCKTFEVDCESKHCMAFEKDKSAIVTYMVW